jgi:hypothetical protein
VWKIEPLVGDRRLAAPVPDGMRTTRVLLPLLAAAALLLMMIGTAGAADTHAPKGARLDWLPGDEWVMSAWMPFDEARLDAVAHTDHDQLVTWLDDHRTLLQLARAHGVPGTTAQIAHALVAPRLAHVRPAMRPVLQKRAETMLTQAHLSRHVIFHVFHTPAIPASARGVFGVSPARFRQLRDRAMTPIAIGAHGGKSAQHVQGALWSLLVKRADRGVALGAMSRSEATHLLAEQKAQLPVYAGRAFRTPEQQVAFLCRPH